MYKTVLSVVLALFFAEAVSSETLDARVVGVADGDTITVVVGARQAKIRLAEIDTPERSQPWGARAKKALSDKVFGERVRIVVVDKDRYGRLIGYVERDGRQVNREMVAEGHAWVYRKYLRDRTFLAVEDEARAKGAGLWSLPDADKLPPWEWRKTKRRTRPSSATAEVSHESYACGEKRYCRDMASCDEARF